MDDGIVVTARAAETFQVLPWAPGGLKRGPVRVIGFLSRAG